MDERGLAIARLRNLEKAFLQAKEEDKEAIFDILVTIAEEEERGDKMIKVVLRCFQKLYKADLDSIQRAVDYLSSLLVFFFF